jgi:hypothetical protein
MRSQGQPLLGQPISFEGMANGEPDSGRPSWMPLDDVLAVDR